MNGSSNPAAPGSIVSVWGTGFGSIDPPCATGGMNPDVAANLDSVVSMTVCGQNVSARYAGSAPGMACGVQQINFAVPASVHGTCTVWPVVAANFEPNAVQYISLVGTTIAVQ